MDRLAMQPVLEFALDDMVDGAYYAIDDDHNLQGAEGRTDWHQPVITLAASTYANLRRGDPRARMTVAHELGHLLMHSRAPVYHYRTRAFDKRVNPEWQADYFAAALLMPAYAMRSMKTVKQVMKGFGVSRGAAIHRSRGLNIKLFDDVANRDPNKKKGVRHTPHPLGKAQIRTRPLRWVSYPNPAISIAKIGEIG